MAGVGKMSLLEHWEHINGGNPFQSVSVANNEPPELLQSHSGQLRNAGARQVAGFATI